MAYDFSLPAELDFVHHVFDISMLMMFLGDLRSILPVKGFLDRGRLVL